MALFPHAPTPWVDLSTGINPSPYPVGKLPDAVWTRLPEPADVETLEAAARCAYGAARAADVLAAPGTQALIQLLPRLFSVRRVGILNFTYHEHEICWREAGADVTTVAALADLAAFDVGVVVNPNNPDGRMAAPEDLGNLARTMARRGGRVIVDEAFMDLEGQAHSLVPHLPADDAIVLRSFGKTYGLAGVRLGFAVGSDDDIARLRRGLGPWSVSGPAIEIGRRALMDEPWRDQTARHLRAAAARLDDLLRRAGFQIVGGTSLFRLGSHLEAGVLFDRMCRAGILTRPFPATPNLLRFGIPNGAGDWARLAEALAPEGGEDPGR